MTEPTGEREFVEKWHNQFAASEPQPAPSAEPSVVSDAVPVPTVPGWYECRMNDVEPDRICRYWNGEAMSDHVRPCDGRGVPADHYADFRRLVPADVVEELVRAASELLSLARHIEVLGEWEALGNNARLRRETRVKVEAAEARLRAALAQLEPGTTNQEDAE